MFVRDLVVKGLQLLLLEVRYARSLVRRVSGNYWRNKSLLVLIIIFIILMHNFFSHYRRLLWMDFQYNAEDFTRTYGYDYNYSHILENKCVLPVITAAEPDIVPFLKTFNNSIFDCPLYNNLMIVQHPEEGTVQFVHPSQRNLGYYKCFIDHLNGTEETMVHFEDEIDIDAPVYTVRCVDQAEKTIYHDVYSNLKSFKVPERYTVANQKMEEKPNILMILIDGITGNSFQREMPLTKQFLEGRNGAFMKGFNRHSSQSFQNIFASLTGKLFEPDKHNLNDSMSSLLQLSNSQLHNSTKAGWIFDDARKMGYTTHFNDDSDFLKKFDGMDREVEVPVDVNLRKFHQTLKKISLFPICHNGKMSAIRTIDEMKKFLNVFKGHSTLSVNLISASTQFFGVLPEIDEYLYSTLHSLDLNGVIDNTIIFLSSTQEATFGPIPHTITGNLENRFPPLAISLPKSYVQRYQARFNNLKKNENRLTVYFDVYETLRDVIGLERATFGISLLREMSSIRTCEDVYTTDEHCGCMDRIQTDQVFEFEDQQIVINTNEHRILNQLYRLECSDSIRYARADKVDVYAYNMTTRINNYHTTVLPTSMSTSVEVIIHMPITIFWKNPIGQKSNDFSIRSRLHYNLVNQEARMIAQSFILVAQNGCKEKLLKDVCKCQK